MRDIVLKMSLMELKAALQVRALACGCGEKGCARSLCVRGSRLAMFFVATTLRHESTNAVHSSRRAIAR